MSDLRRFFSERWEQDGAEEDKLLTHDLTDNSIVFDVGGYVGQWSARIVEKYNPRVYIFEPVGHFASQLNKRSIGSVYAFGLGSRDGLYPMMVKGSSTGVTDDWRDDPLYQFRNASEAIPEVLGVPSIADVRIDLMAVNIEGGEYDLLPHLIETGLIKQIRSLVIQFHPLWPSCYDMWREIDRKLHDTHELTWEYPFVWSKYMLKSPNEPA